MGNCNNCGRLVNLGEGANDYPQGVTDVGEDKETLCVSCLKLYATIAETPR